MIARSGSYEKSSIEKLEKTRCIAIHAGGASLLRRASRPMDLGRA